MTPLSLFIQPLLRRNSRFVSNGSLTFFSSFSEAEGETPRMSYSFVSTTFAMMLTGYTEKTFCGGSAERGTDARSTGWDCPGLPDTTTDTNTHSETDARKRQPANHTVPNTATGLMLCFHLDCVVIFVAYWTKLCGFFTMFYKSPRLKKKKKIIDTTALCLNTHNASENIYLYL